MSQYSTLDGDEIEEEKYYRTRDGDKALIVFFGLDRIVGVLQSTFSRQTWHPNGREEWGGSDMADKDIISPWKEDIQSNN